jgi:oligopeptide/dipeptide ABC transporter ATP-binding protein
VAVMYLGRVVEQGSWKAVIDHPRHPYTEALRDAVPVPDPRRSTSIVPMVQGEIPDPASVVVGCAFAPRCPIAEDVCRRVEPPLLDIAPLHAIACHVRAREAGVMAAAAADGSFAQPT